MNSLYIQDGRLVRVPTLAELRRHIAKHGWNGRDLPARDTHRDYFDGQCEYASTSLSELLTGDEANWSLRVRGWYSGDLTRLEEFTGSLPDGKHCHSWVEFDGKIIDPTWWQFAGERTGIYVFEAGDPRFTADPAA